MENLKDIVVIYHAACQDGFGAAYAAWKKFGETASYIPRRTQTELPEGLTDKEIYIVDYSYSKETLEQLQKANRSVVVIDHHETARDAVTAFSENIFDLEHSGAVLAWHYFHPDLSVPRVLLYIEDNDLWKHALSDNRAFGAAFGEVPSTFEAWDRIAAELQDDQSWDTFIATGRTIARFEDSLVTELFTFKEKIQFEGTEMYAINCSRIYRSILGHHLASANQKEGRIAIGIIYYHYDGGVHCSLRSNGDVDVRILAEKHGGGGHKNAASFQVNSFNELPFTFL